jgi:hypothetical protein
MYNAPIFIAALVCCKPHPLNVPSDQKTILTVDFWRSAVQLATPHFILALLG